MTETTEETLRQVGDDCEYWKRLYYKEKRRADEYWDACDKLRKELRDYNVVQEILVEKIILLTGKEPSN